MRAFLSGKIKPCLFLLFTLTFFQSRCFAQNIDDRNAGKELIGTSSDYLEEKGTALTIQDIIHRQDFTPNKTEIINLGVSKSYFWIRFDVHNHFGSENLLLEIDQPTLNYVALYLPDSAGGYKEKVSGNNYHFSKRENKTTPNYVFALHVPLNKTVTYYLRVKGNTPMVIPVFVGKQEVIAEDVNFKKIFFGIYAGIIACMFFYNLFLMFSVKEDKSYFWYVLHTLLVGLTQGSILGYTFQFLWPDNTWLAQQSFVLFTCLVSVAGIIFLQVFLSTRSTIPKLNKVFYVSFVMYAAIISLSLSGNYDTAYKMLQPTQGMVALFIIFISAKLVLGGYKQARFYLLSWFLFMIGIIIFALKDFNVIPYNMFTSTIMLSGSAVQVILLSFALGDKINILQGDKERLQEERMQALQENERIVREQNVILEHKVAERTEELQTANTDLSQAMKELKEAESQLVESEKMASLGQLTAGIAHEINNPINFVTSNVKPLQRDVAILLDTINNFEQLSLEDGTADEKQKKIKDYKTDIDFDYLKMEIDHLLSGIGEGASRTAEIVKGLRIFSRLDEDDLKRADVNEGLDSTLVITNNLMNNRIKLTKEYGNLPLIECYPGKLNQVFLNIISNAIYAINKQWGEQPDGELKIITSHDEDHVFIKFVDNGTGMDEQTKKKLYEPFFTTKDVGEGTGLGMSIAYNTINKHNGTITVNSELGKGTEFIIELPLRQ